jgi:hypothetical protein
LTIGNYNTYIVFVKIDQVLASDVGPRRTAALVKWLQSLFKDDATVPVLVGGAAVELYTLGAYTTGDVDLIGSVTPRVARALTAADFERHRWSGSRTAGRTVNRRWRRSSDGRTQVREHGRHPVRAAAPVDSPPPEAVHRVEHPPALGQAAAVGG